MKRTVLAAAAAVLALGGLGAAVAFGLQSTPAGSQSFAQGPLETALDEVRRSAEAGDAAAQYLYGRRFEQGEAVLQDYVHAHLWYNLAATNGHQEAAAARERLAARMTAAQIAKAQDLASSRLASPTAATTPPASAPPVSTPPASALPDIAAIQRRLNQLGYKAGSVDGKLGSQTRSALRAWQRDTGLPAGDAVTTEMAARLLGGEAQPGQQLASAAGGPELATLEVDGGAIRYVQEQLNSLGYQAGTVDGRMGSRTRSALRAFQRDNGLSASGEIDEALLTALRRPPAEGHLAEAGRLAAAVAEVQRELSQHGYWSGPQTGEVSPALRQAILEYQGDAGLPASGQVSDHLLDHLRYARPEVVRQARAR